MRYLCLPTPVTHVSRQNTALHPSYKGFRSVPRAQHLPLVSATPVAPETPVQPSAENARGPEPQALQPNSESLAQRLL